MRKQTNEDFYMPRYGYMGHLYVMANAISASMKTHSTIFYFLEDLPNKAWKKFSENTLKQVLHNLLSSYFADKFKLGKTCQFANNN